MKLEGPEDPTIAIPKNQTGVDYIEHPSPENIRGTLRVPRDANITALRKYADISCVECYRPGHDSATEKRIDHKFQYHDWDGHEHHY